jgi:hypothetical protein
MSREPIFPNQCIPLALTTLVFGSGVGVFFFEIALLNHFVQNRELVIPILRWPDVLIGLTIYLKTSIDFAIFIGRLMHKYPGWKNRVLIEIGTAVGNIAGTMAILLIWDIFREVKILMAIMIVIAALVLLRMAEEGLEHVKNEEEKYLVQFWGLENIFEKILHSVNTAIAPVLNTLVPRTDMKEESNKTPWKLFLLACSIPFILGLDDFAGYLPLFNVVNVFGFATGVFGGHMLLNIALFAAPKITIRAVKHPVISFAGSVAFVGLAVWGGVEAVRLLVVR